MKTTKTMGLLTAGLIFAGVVGAMLPSVAAAGDDTPTQRELFRKGAKLWPQVCGGCHNARPGGERSPAEWDAIMLHMRVRANLAAEEAEAIRTYLRSR